MKCNNCKKKIEDCKSCHNEFELGHTIICMDNEVHVCDHECLFDALAETGNAGVTEVID